MKQTRYIENKFPDHPKTNEYCEKQREDVKEILS